MNEPQVTVTHSGGVGVNAHHRIEVDGVYWGGVCRYGKSYRHIHDVGGRNVQIAVSSAAALPDQIKTLIAEGKLRSPDEVKAELAWEESAPAEGVAREAVENFVVLMRHNPEIARSNSFQELLAAVLARYERPITKLRQQIADREENWERNRVHHERWYKDRPEARAADEVAARRYLDGDIAKIEARIALLRPLVEKRKRDAGLID